MRIILFIFLVVTLSCQSERKTDASLVLDEYLKYNKNLSENKELSLNLTYTDTTIFSYNTSKYRVVTEKFPNALSLYKVVGYLEDNPNPYGTYFHFDNYGKLDKYLYLCGDGHRNTYEMKFSYDRDQYEEQGDAFVDYFPPVSLTDSGNIYTLLFTTFPRNEIEAFYSIDSTPYIKLHLNNGLGPFIKIAEISLSKQNVSKDIKLKIKAKNLKFPLLGITEVKETFDTLKFSK